MVKISAEVTKDLGDFEKLKRITNPKSPEMRALFKRWAQWWRSDMFKRFDRYSRGGGDWKHTKRSQRRGRGRPIRAIAPSTIKQFILRDTHTLYKALSPVYRNLPGQYQKLTGTGIEVGYGGPARHPKSKTKTVAQIAQFHQSGSGFLPQRKVIVQPDKFRRETFEHSIEELIDSIQE